jgi:chromosome segregation ATPase
MRLKRIELFGFKSFGRKVDLHFTSQITAVVGPNGSGKSNVADAIRFVLGETSMKSMRGKRVEDMIFGGSHTAARGNVARVSIIFDNLDRAMPIATDEVKITREAYRDGANNYYINDSTCRMRDIYELVASINIGTSGHHMISQGEADRILLSSPKDRRTMLEDALGLTIFQYKRAESERRLTKTEKNLSEVESLRREIAPHLKFLERQMKKIEEGKALREKLIGLYREYLKREEIYLTEAKAALAGKLSGPQEKLTQVEQQIMSARAQLSGEQRDDDLSGELLSVEDKLRAIRQKRDNASRSLGKIDGMIELEERRIKRKEEQAAREVNITLRLIEVEGLESEIDGLMREVAQSNDITTWRDAAHRAHKLVREFINAKKAEGASPVVTVEEREELEAMRDERIVHEEELRIVDDEQRVVEEEYRRVKLAIDASKEQSREAERVLFTLVQERSELLHSIDTLRAQEETLGQNTRRLEDELQEAAILLGRSVLDHSSVVLTIEEVMLEARNIQETRRRDIERGKLRIEDLGAAGGIDVEKEYQETVERDAFLAREVQDLIVTQESLRALIEELEEKVNEQFHTGVKEINKQFSDFFRLMFGGGVAEVKIVKIEKRKKKDTDLDLSNIVLEAPAPEEGEGEDEPEEGVDVYVSLPNKKIKGMQMLSGGERALTAIALMFAISQVNPPPFMMLDETDAALDEANSRKYGDMLEALARHSQLLVITHNRETMSRATTLYGVTMGTEAISRVLSIGFDEASAGAAK